MRNIIDIIKDLMMTWTEWHALVIGFGDGVSFTHTNWDDIPLLYDDGLEGELHYYKFGSALGRLTWALIIASLLIRFME